MPTPSTRSPNWGPSVKLVVSLTFVAMVSALLIRFGNIIGPLLLAVILAYVLHPLASWISHSTRLSWRTSVNLIFLVLVILLLVTIAVAGLALVQQTQNLFRVVQRFINDLPDLVEEISLQVYQVGPLQLNMSQLLGQYDLESLTTQILGAIQPVLGQAGSLVSALANTTITTLWWGVFILLVSYFTLADAGRVPNLLAGVQIPGYDADFRRLGRELGRIWNAFMRGQLFLFIVSVLSASFVLTVLGVRNSLALALLAGLARFVPYIGPFLTWLVTGLVAFFQGGNYFGIAPIYYVLLVVGIIIIIDQIFDTIVTPRLYGQVLGLHPAAVLVAAIVAANLIGFIGLLLAAPVLATLMLFGRYGFRKLLDMDPWPGPEPQQEIEFPGVPTLRRLWARIKKLNPLRRKIERRNP